MSRSGFTILFSLGRDGFPIPEVMKYCLSPQPTVTDCLHSATCTWQVVLLIA